MYIDTVCMCMSVSANCVRLQCVSYCVILCSYVCVCHIVSLVFIVLCVCVCVCVCMVKSVFSVHMIT